MLVSSRAMAHGLSPAGVVVKATKHSPLVQVVLHTRPQPPQFLGSVCSLTHPVPHIVLPVAHPESTPASERESPLLPTSPCDPASLPEADCVEPHAAKGAT